MLWSPALGCAVAGAPPERHLEPAAAAAHSPAELAGPWRSEPCATRNHPRLLDLHVEGTFRAKDLISPCPEPWRCIWSGVEVTEGSWQLEGSRVLLSPGVPDGIARLASVLEWVRPDTTESGRDSLDSQDGCHFERVPSPDPVPLAPPSETQPGQSPSEKPAAGP